MNMERSPQSKFARDIVLFVSSEFVIGPHLLPFSIFTPDRTSPFTPAVQEFFKGVITLEEGYLARLISHFSSIAPVTAEQHSMYSGYYVEQKLWRDQWEFTIKSSLETCAFLAIYGKLALIKGIVEGLFISIQCIIRYLNMLDVRRHIDHNFWRDVQNFCESRQDNP
ncbi:hypothetical protein NPIL_2731 [Nephila pilipes]|uniref:Uncharacterized protein n=1 Tax=Nephila pilipes TaxID=299642 RepID=A0A8X6NYD7_NEPPI|nr:hypothetical protein NPIL_2731 [Nephila pilipes]